MGERSSKSAEKAAKIRSRAQDPKILYFVSPLGSDFQQFVMFVCRSIYFCMLFRTLAVCSGFWMPPLKYRLGHSLCSPQAKLCVCASAQKVLTPFLSIPGLCEQQLLAPLFPPSFLRPLAAPKQLIQRRSKTVVSC